MLPEEIRVGSMTYELAYVPSQGFPSDVDGDEFFGLTVHDEQVVYINTKCKDELSKIITIHEALHTMIFQTGWSGDFEQEENLCRTLAPLLTSFIRDNPEIVAYIGS